MNDALDLTGEPAPARRRCVGMTALVVAAMLILANVVTGTAAPMPTYWFAGSALTFERPQMRADTIAVAINDAGLTHFLLVSGATIASDDVTHTVIVTTANHRLIRFDRRRAIHRRRRDARRSVRAVPQRPQRLRALRRSLASYGDRAG